MGQGQPADRAGQQFARAPRRLLAYLQGRDLFVQDCYVGADPNYRLPVRVVTETAWHSLFARNMFIQASTRASSAPHEPQFIVISAPGFHADPELDGTRSEVFIVLNFAAAARADRRHAVRGRDQEVDLHGHELPAAAAGRAVRCTARPTSAPNGDVALFFGLSGTGKTTLSADPARALIGDDEHGWSDRGVFNFEGGCYAKVIRLSPDGRAGDLRDDAALRHVLENVGSIRDAACLDLDDDSLTENTRAAYPISHIPNATSRRRRRATRATSCC